MLSCVFEVSCVFNVVWWVVYVNRLIGNKARFGLGIFPTFKTAIKLHFLAIRVSPAALLRVGLVQSFIHNYKLSLLLFNS